MKRRSIIRLVLICLLSSQYSAANEGVADAFIKGKKNTWSSKGHPKSKGLNIKISYPDTWKAAEGTRPNILHKFVGRTPSGTDVVTLTTKAIPEPFDGKLTDAQKREVLAKDMVLEMLPQNAKLLSHEITKLDGELCAMAEFIYVTERVGVKIAQKGMLFVVLRPGVMLMVQCGTGGDASKGLQAVHARYEKSRKLYVLIGASVVFVDKWE